MARSTCLFSQMHDFVIRPRQHGTLAQFILDSVPLPHFQPMPLGRSPRPFSHRDWLFEIKWDGFRCIVRIEHGQCRLISRNGNEFKSFGVLNETLPSLTMFCLISGLPA